MNEIDWDAVANGLDDTGKTVTNIIHGHEVNNDLDKENFKQLIELTDNPDVVDSKSYKGLLVPGETAIVRSKYFSGELTKDQAQCKNGKWKLSKCCSVSTYGSNKSVICQCLDAGISLKDDQGNWKGKTALQAELKEGKGDTKTPYEKVMGSLGTYQKVFAKYASELTNEQLDIIQSVLLEEPVVEVLRQTKQAA